jgi:hypothetical protein
LFERRAACRRRAGASKSEATASEENKVLAIYRLAIGLIAGLCMLVFGVLALTDSTVKCGGDVMSPGDTCTTTRKGVTTERTYDEQLAANRRTGLITTAGGPVVALFCGALLVGAIRKRRARSDLAGPVSHRA